MSVEVMASRYAGAVCDLVDDEDLDEFVESLRALHGVFEPVMETVFGNPNVSEDRQLRLIDRLFEDQSAPVIQRFCKLLIRKNRFQYFGEIVDACATEANRRLGRKPARVETPFELGDARKVDIREQLGELFDADIVIDEENTPELLAGLRVKIDDYLMDYSVGRQLDELRSRLSAGDL